MVLTRSYPRRTFFISFSRAPISSFDVYVLYSLSLCSLQFRWVNTDSGVAAELLLRQLWGNRVWIDGSFCTAEMRYSCDVVHVNIRYFYTPRFSTCKIRKTFNANYKERKRFLKSVDLSREIYPSRSWRTLYMYKTSFHSCIAAFKGPDEMENLSVDAAWWDLACSPSFLYIRIYIHVFGRLQQQPRKRFLLYTGSSRASIPREFGLALSLSLGGASISLFRHCCSSSSSSLADFGNYGKEPQGRLGLVSTAICG